MSEYIVSARKYRPATFEEVVGQGHVTKTLYNEIRNDHLAQAFLFCGPRGVGKTTCARILAREINKDSIEDENYDYSFNIFELDAASNNTVEDIRALNEQVRIPPSVGKYKVYIIDEVHMLSSSAFNAFLKTLEEPPAYAVFILATTERQKIIPTILSRCQVFNFKRISIEDMVGHMKTILSNEGWKAEDEALHVIAQKADGALRDALSIFDQMLSIGEVGAINYEEVLSHLNVLDYDTYFRFSDAFIKQDIAEVMNAFNDVLNAGFEPEVFLSGMGDHFRDIMVSKSERTVELLEVPPAVRSKYLDACGAISQGFIVNAINILNQSVVQLKNSRNQRLHVELCLIKLCYLPSLTELEKKKPLAQLDLSQQSAPKPEPQPQEQVESTPVEAVQDAPEPVIPAEDVVEAPSPQPEIKTEPDRIKFSKLEGVQKRAKKKAHISLSKAKEEAGGAFVKPSDDPNGEVEAETFRRTDDTVSAEQLQKAYDTFREEYGKDGSRSMNALLNIIQPEITEGHIHFTATKAHLLRLEEFKMELLQILRKNAGSRNISIELTESEHVVEGPRAYTDGEKLKEMAKKNPVINKLREGLDLEFD